MSQSTRLLLFHDDGEVKQIRIPHLSPLWILALLSSLTLFAVVLLTMSLRLYHEKREVYSSLDDLTGKLESAMLRIQQLSGTASPAVEAPLENTPLPVAPPVPTPKAPVGATLAEQLMAATYGGAVPVEFTAPGIDLDLEVTRTGISALKGFNQVNFLIRAKEASEEDPLQGRVCGVFITAHGIRMLPNSKIENEGHWMVKPAKSLAAGEGCDPFRIKSSKTYNVSLPESLELGVIQVFNDAGTLQRTVVLKKEPI